MIADELRRQADNFIELEELKSVIMREGGPRSVQGPPRAELQNNNNQFAQTA
jgi:hypothetical protein